MVSSPICSRHPGASVASLIVTIASTDDAISGTRNLCANIQNARSTGLFNDRSVEGEAARHALEPRSVQTRHTKRAADASSYRCNQFFAGDSSASTGARSARYTSSPNER